MSKKNKLIIIVFVIVIILLPIISILLFFDLDKIEIKLNGDDLIKVTYNTKYNDPGIILFSNNNKIDKNKYKVNIKNKVNTEVLGKYKVKYKISYNNKDYEISRKVIVIDDIAPEVTVNKEELEKDYCTKKLKTKLEYTAVDNYDGDITDKVIKEESDEEIFLKVSDSSNNISEKIIKIKYSKKPNPLLKLNGNKTIKIVKGENYEEKGATYQDGCGNVIDSNVNISGNVDTNTNGEYIITYSYNNEKIDRKVIVYTPEVSSGKKIIYLTFDDGPSFYTREILDTLDKYNVKATFFVTHQFPDYEYLLKEEHDKGHTVAVHTFTHNYNLYTSLESYLDDFNKMNDVIEKYTGEKSKLFRFPGGSSNTTSIKYKNGVVTEVANYMNANGYVYFDWNVSSGDASNTSSSGVYNNVVSGVERCDSCVVLLHDIKKSTANALDNILNTLINKGYEFRALTIDSPTTHHRIRN